MALPHHPHDAFFKHLFTRPEEAEDFVRHYLPPEVVAVLEPGSLTICKDSFIDEAFAEHYSDLLYRVQLKTSEDTYIYLLFEHKSAPAPRVALDLLRYMVRIWDFLGKQGNKTPLPGILPLVIYHGKARWRIARSFSSMIDAPKVFKPYLPEFTYLLTDLFRFSDEEIKGAVTLRAGLLILKYIFRGELQERLPGILGLLRELSGQQSGLEFIETVLRYLGSAAEMQKDDLKRVAAQALPEGEQIMATPAEQWIQEGLQKGLEQGERQMLLRLVRRRFSELTAQQSEGLLVKITDLTRLEDLGGALLECRDEAEWLNRLQAMTLGNR
jgi:predicted transposase/invertase (TIGR01784 family)